MVCSSSAFFAVIFSSITRLFVVLGSCEASGDGEAGGMVAGDVADLTPCPLPLEGRGRAARGVALMATDVAGMFAVFAGILAGAAALLWLAAGAVGGGV